MVQDFTDKAHRQTNAFCMFIFFFAPQQSNISAEYLTGIEKGKGKHVVWYDLACVVCHYAEQQGVLIYYCGQ